MIYAVAFIVGIIFGFGSALFRARQLEKKQSEIETFLNETPTSRILKPFAKANKLKPKVNNDERAVERENAF